VLGRTANNTLTLKSDEIGLWGSVEINREDSEAMSAYARIKRGDVAGCSFGFYPIKEEAVKREGGGKKYVIREMDLFEVRWCSQLIHKPNCRAHDIESLKEIRIRKRELKED
jgi:HK97 family phage prohead protease